MNVQFDSETIRYSDDVYIECSYYDDDYSYTFDVFHKDGCERNYCLLHQAHARALAFIEQKETPH